MIATRFLPLAAGLLLILPAGCKNKTEIRSSASASASPLVEQAPSLKTAPAATPKTEPADPMHGTADALAQKTASYAKDMEPLLAKRAPSAAPPEQPSEVKWADADEMHLSSGPVKTKPPENAGRQVQVRQVSTTPSEQTNPNTALAMAMEAHAKSEDPTAANAPSEIHVGTSASPKFSGPAVDANSDALTKKLAQHVRDYPRDVAGQLDYQLMLFVNERPVPQLDAIASLPAEDREVVTAVIDGLSNFRNGVRADNNMLLSKKIRPILDLADRLKSQAELTIPTLALCTRVDGFGVYEPIDPPRFPAGRDHPVIVYCEIGNFASQLTEKKKWQTQLTQEYTLYTETGMPVWWGEKEKGEKTKPIVDLSRNRRNDFFLVKTIRLPGNLSIGRYLLKVTVVDQIASRVAEVTLPVEIVAE